MRIRTATWKEVSIDAVMVVAAVSVAVIVVDGAVIDSSMSWIVMDAIDVMDVNSCSTTRSVQYMFC